jgi:sec-independent protein translocase protein TatC
MVAMGLAFQVPVGVVVACKLRITTPAKLRRGRRYAIVTIVVLAALLPTIDPLSLILESVPMYALYELSIVLASAWGQPIGEVTDQTAPEGSG